MHDKQFLQQVLVEYLGTLRTAKKRYDSNPEDYRAGKLVDSLTHKAPHLAEAMRKAGLRDQWWTQQPK